MKIYQRGLSVSGFGHMYELWSRRGGRDGGEADDGKAERADWDLVRAPDNCLLVGGIWVSWRILWRWPESRGLNDISMPGSVRSFFSGVRKRVGRGMHRTQQVR